MKNGGPCYLKCGGLYKPFLVKNGYVILRCDKCGLLSLEFNKNYDEFISNFYTSGYFNSSEDNKIGYANYLEEEPCIRKNAQSYLRQIKEIQDTGKLLDIGCAAGYFLDEARKIGYDVYGIDVSNYAINYARLLLHDRVTATALHKATFPPNTFDVVVMFDIIEHLADPIHDLLIVKKAMKPGAIIVLCTGDVKSWYAKIMGSHYHFLAPPFHLHFFSRLTIKKLLDEAGFSCFKIIKKGKWVSFQYAMRVLENMHYPLLRKIIKLTKIDKLLGRACFYFYAGDNMIVFAKK